MSCRTMMTCDQCGLDFDMDDRGHSVQAMIYTKDKYNGTKHYCSATCMIKAGPELLKITGEPIPVTSLGEGC